LGDEMAKYKIKESFKGSPDGMRVIEFTKGEANIELTGELEEVAVAEKWVTKMRKPASANTSGGSKDSDDADGDSTKKVEGSGAGSNDVTGSTNSEGSTGEVDN
jgi:hypothetical protein